MNERESEVYAGYSIRLKYSPAAVQWGWIKEDLARMGYFTAPASSKHHLSVAGGLAAHSIAVTALAIEMAKLARGNHPVGDCSANHGPLADWRIILAGLLHDVGKCGYIDDSGKLRPRYTPKSTFVKHKGFTVNDTEPFFTVRDLSALYAARWDLPFDIVQAILVHDGLYDPANRAYENIGPLALLITVADFYQAKGFEGKVGFTQTPAAWIPRPPRVILQDNGGPVLPRPSKVTKKARE